MCSKTAINSQTRYEWRQLAKIGLPILAAQLCQTAIGVTDTIMAGRYHANDLAAIALGYSIWLPAMIAITGLVMAATPLIAHAIGAKRDHEAGHHLLQSQWLALLVGALLFFLVYNSVGLLVWFDVPEVLLPICQRYLQAIAWGMPGIAFYQAWRSYNEGIANTTIIMVIGFLAMLLNIPLNYIFIYGKFGIAEMGGAGCGVASAIAMWLSALALAVHSIVKRHPALQAIQRRDFRPDLAILKTMFLLGYPIAIALFVEMGAFAGIALLLAYAGKTVIAAHQVTLNFTALIFMMPLSVSLAMTIRIGQALGAGHVSEAIFIRRSGQKLVILLALFNAMMIYVFADMIAGLYTRDLAIRNLATSLMLIACVYQLPDSLQISAAGALRGWKDTKVPMFFVMVSFWVVGLPLGFFLSRQEYGGEPLYAHGYWWGLVIGLSMAALLLNGRLYKLERRQLRE